MSYNESKTSFNNTEQLEDAKFKKYLDRIAKSNLVEDIKFREIAKSKKAIEEILRVLLDDDKLEVIECVDQKNLTKCIFHGVILDCECILKTKEIVNVEMQVDLKDNPVYRMRYNQSALTIEHSPKNKHFDYSSIPKIISIMICDFDLFKLGKPVYEIERTIKTTSIIVDNGVRELYVNLKADVKTNKLKELFKILTEYEYLDEKTFPNLTEKKKELSGKLKGENKMTGISREIYMDGKAEGILEGKTEGKAEGVLEGWRDALVELYKQNMISKEYAANKLKMTIDEFLELAKKL